MSWGCGGINSRNAYRTTIKRFFFKTETLECHLGLCSSKTQIVFVTMEMRYENTELEMSWREKEKTGLEKQEI